MTRAPRSPRCREHSGAATACSKVTTVVPDSGSRCDMGRSQASRRRTLPCGVGRVCSAIGWIYSDRDSSPAAGGSVIQRDGLDVDNLTVRFGGLLAVDGVTLEAPVGRLT